VKTTNPTARTRSDLSKQRDAMLGRIVAARPATPRRISCPQRPASLTVEELLAADLPRDECEEAFMALGCQEQGRYLRYRESMFDMPWDGLIS
jgi:hypothetical protein